MEQIIWDLENAESDLRQQIYKVDQENEEYVRDALKDVEKALDRLYYVRDDENEKMGHTR